jgi:hypothetical protein
MNEPWFSVRCVFRHKKRADMTKYNLYEERITLWRADSFDKAIEYAEKEAVEYAMDSECEYIGLAQAYHLYDDTIGNGSEIFSLMREHNYTPKKYLDRYFDTDYERQQD